MSSVQKMGPAPTPGQLPAGLGHGPSAVLRWVRNAAQPVLVADVADGLNLHANTVREHLDALVEAGYVARSRHQRTVGRGRPPWQYEAQPAPPDPGVREYAGLVSALSEHLLQTAADPAGEAETAGWGWGNHLVPHRPRGPQGRVDVTLQVLGDLGFSPSRPDADDTVRLHTCPLLEVADRYPDIVCSVHLGLVRGTLAAVTEGGRDTDQVTLTPFAEPGACVLRIAPADGEAS